MSHPIVWVAALCVVLVGQLSDAHAQGARDEARELARQGIALLDQGQNEEALEKLREAEAKFHAPTHLIYMARALTGMGKLVEAHNFYIDVLVEAIPNYAPDAFHDAQKSATDGARELEAKIATLRVSVTGDKAEQARVTVDGNEIARPRLAHPIAVEAGSHRVEASAPGALPQKREVEAPVGAATDVALELAAEPGAAPNPSGGNAAGEESASAFPIGAGVAFGIGGAALVVATVTGVLTLQRADEIKETCNENVCPPEQEAEADDAKVLGNVSTAMFAIGGAGVALGAILLIAGAASDDEAAGDRPRVDVALGPMGVAVRGSF